MTRINSLRHEFVSYIPEALYDGVLYVSIPFATVMHRCCCGCGNEVVTPLDPTDWQMTFDGRQCPFPHRLATGAFLVNPTIGSIGIRCDGLDSNGCSRSRKAMPSTVSGKRCAAAGSGRRFKGGSGAGAK